MDEETHQWIASVDRRAWDEARWRDRRIVREWLIERDAGTFGSDDMTSIEVLLDRLGPAKPSDGVPNAV